jgi:hypothetical protein
MECLPADTAELSSQDVSMRAPHWRGPIAVARLYLL